MTIKDIASLAGVSVTTVSRVLNNRRDVGDQTRKLVLDVVERVQYEPNAMAKRLKVKDSDDVAVIIRGTQNIFLLSIVERLQFYVENSGFNFLLHYIDERDDEFAAAQKIRGERKVRGVIFLGGSAIGREHELEAIGVPCVFATQSAKGAEARNVSSVCIDDYAASMRLGEYLIGNGHRRIAVVGGVVDNLSAIKLRYDGFIGALLNSGIDFDTSLYLTAPFSPEAAHRVVAQALDSGKQFSAVFAMSDTMAMGVISAITCAGLRVPDDISVVGYDGIELGGYYSPPITTVRQPIDQIARDCVKLLSKAIRGAAPEYITVEYEFIERQSVAQIC